MIPAAPPPALADTLLVESALTITVPPETVRCTPEPRKAVVLCVSSAVTFAPERPTKFRLTSTAELVSVLLEVLITLSPPAVMVVFPST